MRYIFSTVRFVPDPARGEFVNVGAIAGSEESAEWRLRLVDNLKRARALDDRGALSGVFRFAAEIDRSIDAHDESLESISDAQFELTEAWLNRVWEDSRNIVQLSRPSPISAESVDEALNIVFDELVIDPETRRHEFETKTPVLGKVRAAYRREGIHKGDHLVERQQVRGPHHHQRFDFAVANGQVVQLLQGWSFQIPNQSELSDDVKAWAWSVQDVRAGGGVLDTPSGKRLHVPKGVPIVAVYTPPLADQPTNVMNEALNAFEEVDVRAVPVDHADEIAHQAHELLSASGVELVTSDAQTSFG